MEEYEMNSYPQQNPEDEAGKLPGENSCTRMILGLLDYGQQIGILPALDGFPNIPEIMVMAPQFCEQLMFGMMELSDAGEDDAMPAMPMWALLGGIGAVLEWKRDPAALKENGLYQTLTQRYGLECMDEYVLCQMGIEAETEEYMDLSRRFSGVCARTMALSQEYSYTNVVETTQEQLKTLFFFGMVYRMCQIGMA